MSTIPSSRSAAPDIRRENAAVARLALIARVAESADDAVAICQQLIRTPSENPPGDTHQIAHVAAEILRRIDGCEVELVIGQEPFVNVVARIKGAGPGRRVVLNGHLDTFPVGDRNRWSVDPLGGLLREGRLYGRGAADMKGGMAASIMALKLLAETRPHWSGEAVLTLAADEESMGRWGSAYLLEAVPHARGDALICGDAGSPKVIRFGEKGLLWLEITAHGKASHGAHVHLGRNALDLLVLAVQKVQTLGQLTISAPPEVTAAIRAAKPISEAISGAGEAEVLRSVTVNLGVVHAGTSLNLVPAAATAALDLRLPVGTSVEEITARIAALLGPLHNVEFRVLNGYDPTYSDPRSELFELLVKNGTEVLGTPPVVNMRVGASDTRIFRKHGVVSAVYGCTPHNMGGPDEFITLDDLRAVLHVHTLTAFDFLQHTGSG